MYYTIIILAILLPISTITAFIIGFNINATESKKILVKKPKNGITGEEELLARIDKAHI